MQPSAFKTLAWVGFILVLIGTALPWAYVESHTQRTEIDDGRVTGFEERSVGGLSLPGYRSSAGVQGFSLPGWLVIVVSLVCAVVTARPSGSFSFPLLLCGYGLLHAGFMAIALWNTPNMAPSYGILCVLAGFTAQSLGVILKDRVVKRAASAAK